MAKKFLTIEIGDNLVKVAVCVGTDKKRKVKTAFFYEPLAETVQDGIVIDAPKFALDFAERIQEAGCGDAKEVFFSISSSKVATREVQMPLLKDSKIENVVENNKSEYFPLDVSNYKVMFRVMSREKKGENKGCNVLVIAMPNAALEACAQIANGLKLRLKGVDAVCSTLADGVIQLKQSQVTAFVHVDCTNTNMVFMQGSELLLQRSSSFGGDEMIMAYRETTGGVVSYLEALEHLTSISAEDYIRGKLEEEDVRVLLEQAVGRIHLGVEYYRNHKGGEVAQIVLSGACGGLLGLEELVEHATGVPTIQFIQLSTATAYRDISPVPAYYIAGMYAGTHGLNFGKDFDAKKNKGKRAKSGELDMPTTLLIFILLMVFSVYWSYSILSEKAQMETELARLEKEVADMQYLYVISDDHTKYQESKESLLNFTNNTTNPNENLVLFLAELEAKMPSEIVVLSATCTSASVSMNVVVSSLVEAATVISKMRTFDSIEVIQVSGFGMGWVQMEGSEFSAALNEGYEEVTFSLICNYGINPYTAGWNPYAEILGISNETVLAGGTDTEADSE